MNLIKSTSYVFVLFLLSFNVFAIDLTKLEGKWAGITTLGDLDMYAALIIQNDLSGEYIEASFTAKNSTKRTFTADDIIAREGYIEISMTKESDIAPQKLIFIKNGNEIRGMHIANIKDDIVLYCNLKLMKSQRIANTQKTNN